MPPLACSILPCVVLIGAGERALLVAEELALEQLLGNGRAVDGLEARLGAAAQVVHGPCEQFLAGAALAEDQHRRVGRRHLLDHATHLLHRLVAGDEAGERCARACIAQLLVLLLEVVDVERAAHDQLEHVRVHGLLAEVVGALGHGPDAVLGIGLAGDDDHLGARRDAQGLGQGREALGHAFRVRGQTEVLEHHGRFMPTQGRDRGGAGIGDDDLAVVEAPLELLLQPGVVLDDEELWLFRAQAVSAAGNPVARDCG